MKEKLRSWVIRKEVLVVPTASTHPQLHSSVFPSILLYGLDSKEPSRLHLCLQEVNILASDKGILMSLLHFISDGLSHLGLES